MAALVASNKSGAALSLREAPDWLPRRWAIKALADLLLELDTDGVGLLQEDGITPQQVSQGGELVRPPLAEAPQGQLRLLLGPLDWGSPWKHNGQGRGSTPKFPKRLVLLFSVLMLKLDTIMYQ